MKIIFILLLAMVSNVLLAQNKDLVFNVVKPNPGALRVSPNYECLIYGVASKISISTNIKGAKLALVLAGGSVLIRKSDTVLVAEKMDAVTLYVYDYSTDDSTLVKTIEYKVIERPTLYLGGESINPGYLRAYDPVYCATKLDVRTEVDGVVTKYEVKSFDITYSSNGGVHVVKIKGNRLSERAKEQIGRCEFFCNIYFGSICFEISPNQLMTAGGGRISFRKCTNPVYKR